MKKRIMFLAIASLVVASTKAQFSVSYSAGYGEYKMNDVKPILENILSAIHYQYPEIPFAVVDQFPGYVTHSIDLTYALKKSEIGIRGTYLTTGGNVAYSDYTGEYSGKLILNGYRFGLNYRFYQPVAQFNKLGSLRLFAEFSPAVTFSSMKSKEKIRIFEESHQSDNNLNMKAKGISLLPQIGVKWSIIPLMDIYISGGYDFQLGSHFDYQGQKTEVKSDWSGLRLNGGLSLTLGK